MKTLFWKYRLERITSPYNLDSVSLNGWYTMSFFLNNQFGDYYDAGLTDIEDSPIPDDRYIWETTWPKWTFPKLSRLFLANYDESQDVELYKTSLLTKGYRFSVELFETIEDCIKRIKANTNLEEIEPWKFLISPEVTEWPFKQEAQFLEIN